MALARRCFRAAPELGSRVSMLLSSAPIQRPTCLAGFGRASRKVKPIHNLSRHLSSNSHDPTSGSDTNAQGARNIEAEDFKFATPWMFEESIWKHAKTVQDFPTVKDYLDDIERFRAERGLPPIPSDPDITPFPEEFKKEYRKMEEDRRLEPFPIIESIYNDQEIPVHLIDECRYPIVSRRGAPRDEVLAVVWEGAAERAMIRGKEANAIYRLTITEEFDEIRMNKAKVAYRSDNFVCFAVKLKKPPQEYKLPFAQSAHDPSLPRVYLGLVAHKKSVSPKAVDRNRVRRRLRIASHLMLPEYGVPDCAYYVTAKPGTLEANWVELVQDFKKGLLSIQKKLLDKEVKEEEPDFAKELLDCMIK